MKCMPVQIKSILSQALDIGVRVYEAMPPNMKTLYRALNKLDAKIKPKS